MSKKYQKLGADEDAGDSKELDLSTASPDQLNPSSGIEMQVKTFSVKILLNEQTELIVSSKVSQNLFLKKSG